MASTRHAISSATRRNVFDYMSMTPVAWAGRLAEPDFIVRVWPTAKSMPSYDPRFKDAIADTYQHRINNYDWEDDWIFTDARFDLMNCDDKTFLAFLAEVVHPVVRPDPEKAEDILAEFNRQLRPDGFVLSPTSQVSGRSVYEGSRLSATHDPHTALNLSARNELEDHRALQDHLAAIARDIANDPAGAITSAKDLVESMYKLILDKRGIAYQPKDDLGTLYKKVATELALDKKSVPSTVKGSEAAQKTLGALNTVVTGLAELRNQIGRGHGRTEASPALERHARLAFNAAVALTEFLYDTLQDRAFASSGAEAT
ncbi:MAG: abortive infection family protein [Actinomycetota bacterium]|nr:abortive infection family protein [Actinomycetota bacterium]